MDSGILKCVVLVVDDMPFRRAQTVAFLGNWARDYDMEIIDKNLDEVMAWSQPAPCRLIVLSIGSGILLQERYGAALRLFAALYKGVPVAVIGDGLGDARIALATGAAGYIPSSLAAKVALAALDFLMVGGSFFPKEMLEALSGDPQRGRLLPPTPSKSDHQDGTGGLGRSSAGNGSKPFSGHDAELGQECGSSDSEDDQAQEDGTDPEILSKLTRRQCEVLQRLRCGQSNKHIARELEMSEATVKVHVRQVMRRLGATNRTQAAVMAFAKPPRSAPLKEAEVPPPMLKERPILRLAIPPSLQVAG